jgi:secreted PhoX family phosphatase
MPDSDDLSTSPQTGPHLDEVLRRISRRRFLGGTVVAAATGFLGGSRLAALVGGDVTADQAAAGRLTFKEVPPSSADTFVVPDGYTWAPLAPWGTPLLPGAPPFAEDASNTAADQARQVGFNHDGMHYFPLGPDGNTFGLLVVNHEYTDASQIYSAAQGRVITPDAAGREKVAKALAAHGVSVIAIRRGPDGTWDVVRDDLRNRRITGTTPMAFAGPVRADHPLLQSSITPSPIGTLNNCAHGVTPWGTYLTCEENFNLTFGTDDPEWIKTRSALQARYGVTAEGGLYDWHKADPRFDVAKNPNELNRFGWVVEIDPFDPTSVPVKRTTLGRVKHECATCTESRGRVVVYSGDDQNGDYVYKFVGSASWREQRAAGLSPLDNGTLHVGRFGADGSGEWLPLVHGTGPLTPANGWIDQADVLIRTRMAADALGATRLHRPEWVTVHPQTGEVFLTLTNGSGNSAPVNAGRDPNPYGHILRWTESPTSDVSFQWEVFLLAGDPQYDPRVPADQPLFGSPDGLWVDPDGILWIQTDVSNTSQNRGDREHERLGNNAMLAADPATREVKRFLTGPRGCEISGVIMTPDRRTMFVNVQHPGESTTRWDVEFGVPSPARPSTVSSWPYGRRARPTTVVIRRVDGQRIGS